MTGKIIQEKVISSREYAGKTLFTKEQRFVTQKIRTYGSGRYKFWAYLLY